MKKNSFKKSLWAALMLLGSVVMTGCVAETDQEIPAGGGEGNLYISIRTESIGSTRGVTIGTNPDTDVENQLEKTLICIFDGDGNQVEYQVIDDLMILNNHKTFSTANYAAGYKVVVLSNVPDAVLTAITDKLDADLADHAGSPYVLADLQAEQLTIANALNDDVLNPTTADDRRIPMYGEGTVMENDANNFYVSIGVKHSLVKVTLNQLMVDFGESTTRNAKFTVDQVFLTNVPDVANIKATDDANDIADVNANMYQGNDVTVQTYTTAATAGINVNSTEAEAAKRLAASTIDGSNILGTDVMVTAAADELSTTTPNWSKQYYFYTVPNKLTGNDATCLVISGKFDATGDTPAADQERVYYSVKLNGNGDDKLLPNRNYKVNILLYGKGASNPYVAASDPLIMESYITVNPFSNEEGNVVLGGSSVAYTGNGAIVKVGDILFSDGSFASQTDAVTHFGDGSERYPIGIVFHIFSNEERAANQYNGKTGLVMALKDAASDADGHTVGKKKWGDNNYGLSAAGLRLEPGTTYVEAENPEANSSKLDTHSRTVAAYLKTLTNPGNNGLKNWNTVATNERKTAWDALNLADNDAGDAFAAVYEFDADGAGTKVTKDVTTLGTLAPLATSGWYLPSIGELYKMTYSLGRLDAGQLATTDVWGNAASDANEPNKSWNWTRYGMYYKLEADNVRNNINALISVCGAGTYDYFSGGKNVGVGNDAESTVSYWSSSEWSGSRAFFLNFHNSGYLFFSRDRAKSDKSWVRPVLAF